MQHNNKSITIKWSYVLSIFYCYFFLYIDTWSSTSDHCGPSDLNLDDTDRLENIQTFLLFSDITTSTRLRHKLQYLQQYPINILYSTQPAYASMSLSSSGLQQEFPPNIHLLTLMMLNTTQTVFIFFYYLYYLKLN